MQTQDDAAASAGLRLTFSVAPTVEFSHALGSRWHHGQEAGALRTRLTESCWRVPSRSSARRLHTHDVKALFSLKKGDCSPHCFAQLSASGYSSVEKAPVLGPCFLEHVFY